MVVCVGLTFERRLERTDEGPCLGFLCVGGGGFFFFFLVEKSLLEGGKPRLVSFSGGIDAMKVETVKVGGVRINGSVSRTANSLALLIDDLTLEEDDDDEGTSFGFLFLFNSTNETELMCVDNQ